MSELPDPDALLVALVLAPATFSRNKFFDMFEAKEQQRARRRSQMVRSLLKELTEPWPFPGEMASRPKPVVEDLQKHEGELHITYRVEELDYRRKAVLSPIEAAALRYALHRAGLGDLEEGDQALVDDALAKMTPL